MSKCVKDSIYYAIEIICGFVGNEVSTEMPTDLEFRVINGIYYPICNSVWYSVGVSVNNTIMENKNEKL